MAQQHSGMGGRTESESMSPPLVDDVSDEPVSIAGTGDYMVHLDIDGLPTGVISVDYFEDTPRLVITGMEEGEIEWPVVTDHEMAVTVTVEPASEDEHENEGALEHS